MRHCWGTTTMPHTRSGHDQDRSRNMRTRNRRLGPLVQHRRPLSLGGITPQQAEKQHTTTRKEAASTSLHKTRDLTHPLRGIAPVTWRCTRYVALHPLRRAAPVTSRCTRTEGVQCLQIGCNAYTSGAMPTHRVHDPPSQAQMRTCPNGGRRTRQAWLRPAAAHPPQPTATDGNELPTTNRTRQQHTPNNQQGPGTAGSGGASRRRTERAGRGAWLPRHKARARGTHTTNPGASLPRHKARARGTHATNPGPGRAYDEAGTRRAKQRRGPRPRQQVRPGDPP